MRIKNSQERDGLWALPGGWADVGLSIAENAVKEVREEAGLLARAERVVAIQDKDRRNPPAGAFKICKVFVLCAALGGAFCESTETIASGYFSLDALPPLATEKTTREQIQMCLDAGRAPHWETLLD